MNRVYYFPVLFALWWASFPAFGSTIDWRVSVKFILNSSGARPNTNFYLTRNEHIQSEIDMGNQGLARTGRGYRFRLVEIVDVSGISQWFSRNMDETTLNEFDDAAKNDKPRYRWRDDSINIYINEGNGPGGICSLPNSGNDAILVKAGAPGLTLAHECGHFFGLFHTQGIQCGTCDPSKTGTCHTTPGNDEIADTAPDLDCWDQDQIAQFSFSRNYSALTSSEKTLVDNSFFNLMSYHSIQGENVRLTTAQLDKATDNSNGPRINVATGKTWFVDRANGCGFPSGSSQCNFVGGPFPTIAEGIQNATGTDIVLVRSGVYTQAMTINKRVTLRATRGNAFIGRR